ncbi:MAG: hypothetical protein WBV23_05005 [Desulfobaccales bacterium]
MDSSEERTRGEQINTWVQTIGIVLAAAWGIYTFVFTQITLPKSAPLNISIGLSLKRSGTSVPVVAKNGKKFEAIEMKISAQNPSSRIIYLYPNKFIAYGFKVIQKDYNIPKQIPDQQDNFCSLITKHYSLSQSSIIAIADFIPDFFLKPGEKVGRDLIFLVPKGEYDMLQVIGYIPTAADESDEFKLRWECVENNELAYSMYKVSGGKEEKLEKIKGVGFKNYPKKLDWQYAETSSMISLW